MALINAMIAHWKGYNVRLGGTAATEFKVRGTRAVAELITGNEKGSTTIKITRT